MDAGLELDALVAEEVMGLSIVGTCWATTDFEGGELLLTEPHYDFDRQVSVYVRACQCEHIRKSPSYDPKYDILICGHFENCLGIVPSYSTDIAAAWQVVDWLRRQRSNFSLGAANGWGAHVWNVGYDAESDESYDYANPATGYGETAAEAICLLALKVVGVTVD